MSGAAHPDLQLIAGVVTREPVACRAFVDKLTPVIQSRVNAALTRRRRYVRQDVLDLTQEIFRALLEDDARVLRAWDPTRGASLTSYVALIAERRAASILASGRKSGSREDPEGDMPDERSDTDPTPEVRVLSRDHLERLLDALRIRLSDKGYEMFQLLFVEERDSDAICSATGLSRDAVYTWKARILRTVREAERALMSDPEVSSGTEKGGRP